MATEVWGNPLFKFELVRSKKDEQQKGYSIKEILLGVPHLEEKGYTAWRRIKCNTPAISLGDSIHEQGRWFFTSFCVGHGYPTIDIYPPNNAKFLELTNLFTGVKTDLEWKF